MKQSLALYLFVATIFITLAYFQRELSLSFQAEKLLDLNKLQEKNVDVFLEMNRTLITLATLTIGAVSFFISVRYGNTRLPLGQICRAIGCWGFAGGSISLGYLSLNAMSQSLSLSVLDIGIPIVLRNQQFQFYSFGLSVVLLLDFVSVSLSENKKSQTWGI